MEDRDKPKARRAAGDAESIVELTLDMELPEASNVKIIDLTDAIDGPVFVPAPEAPGMESAAATIAETQAGVSPASDGPEAPDVIEQEVDAAFDAVQAPDQEPAPEKKPVAPDGALLDRLSDIPRMVDDAMEKAATGDPRVEEAEADRAEPMETPAADDGDLAADLESAIGGTDPDSEDDEIIQLMDIVDPGQLQADEDDDDIIELTDIVDPSELHVGAVTAIQDDEEILELTDIVDSAEWDTDQPRETPGTAEQSAGPAIREMTGATGVGKGGTADEAEPLDFQPLPEELTPEDRVDPIPIGAIPPFEEDHRQQESVIRLSEVLNHGLPKEERLPIEQIKMGAEEELAKQTISLEAEDTANALGLDLEKETGEEGKPLTDREIEAAVERIIQTKYAETIERLIAKAVEKAVTREIENIKRAMQDGDDPLT